MIISKKYLYLLVLFILGLSSLVLIPTYAKFVDEHTLGEDAVGINLNFNLEISNIEEYEELTVKAHEALMFNVEVENSSLDTIYYGLWYKMVKPLVLNDEIKIARLEESNVTTSGSVNSKESVTIGLVVVNDSDEDIVFDMGVSSSETSINDIEYLGGKYLITDTSDFPRDIKINSIMIDGVLSASLPVSGFYKMTSSCKLGSKLTWDSYNKSIVFGKGTFVRDECDLMFQSSEEYSLLNTVKDGSYVVFNGDNGCNGSSCNGQNANYKDEANKGYCMDFNQSFVTTGFRVAYVLDGNAYLISAGAVDCIDTLIDEKAEVLVGTPKHLENLNKIAAGYCNENYAYGDKCNSDSVWAFGFDDINKILKQELVFANCYSANSNKNCGYNNNLIDNGGFYWIADSYTDSNKVLIWNAKERIISSSDTSYSYGIRPIIKLKSSVYIISGTGTYEDPYVIGV